jgi:hypothetical protein
MAVFEQTGSYSGHLRLRARVDVGDPGPNTTSVTVRLRVWVGTDGWNFNDGQTVSFSGWKSGSQNFTNNLSSGEKEVIDKSWSHSVGSSAVNRSFSAKLSGNSATGSSPSVSVSFRVESRAVSPPNPPSASSMQVWRDGGDDYDPLHRLNWGNSTNNNGDSVNQWTLQIDDNDTFNTPIQALNPSAGARSHVTGVMDRGNRYWWRIRGWNSAGAGPWRVSSFTVGAIAPKAPVISGTSDVTKDSVTLSWSTVNNGGADYTHSYVQMRKVGTSTLVVDGAAGWTGTTRSVSGLSPNTQYEWRIRVNNGVGWSDYSSWGGRFTTESAAPANRPNLSVAVIDATSARMSWTHTVAAGEAPRTGFDWQVSLVDNFSSLVASGTNQSATLQKVVDGLTPATQYYFRVRAKNSLGNGPWSAIKSLSPPQGIRVYLNGAWEAKNLYVWDGEDWAVPLIRGRSGGNWVDAS